MYKISLLFGVWENLAFCFRDLLTFRTAYEYPASKKKFYTGYFFEGQGTSEVLNNNIKVILNDQGGHSDFFEINLELFRTFRGLLILKQTTGRGLFFGRSVFLSSSNIIWHFFLKQTWRNWMFYENR